MATAKKSKIDVESWAKDVKRHYADCRTCQCSDEILEAIRTVMRMIADGESQATVSHLQQMLDENFDYPHGYSALRRHMMRCEKELWEKIDERRNRRK